MELRLTVARRHALAILLTCARAAFGQTEYTQEAGSGTDGGAVSANGSVTVNRLGPQGRIVVKTTVADPVLTVAVYSYTGMVCERHSAPSLELRQRLFERVAGKDAATLRGILQRAQASTSRATQYGELFGVAMPSADASLTGGTERFPPSAALDAQRKNQLNMGQNVVLDLSGSVSCLTLAQVDAAITEAKSVYAAVIAAMEGPARASSGIKPQ